MADHHRKLGDTVKLVGAMMRLRHNTKFKVRWASGLITYYVVYALPRAVLGVNLQWSPHVPDSPATAYLDAMIVAHWVNNKRYCTYKIGTARNTEFFLLECVRECPLGVLSVVCGTTAACSWCRCFLCKVYRCNGATAVHRES